MYLKKRVREPAGLSWNEKNAKKMRERLDRIIVNIKSGTFRFCQEFPESRKKDYFRNKEALVFDFNKRPDEILFLDGAEEWYSTIEAAGRVTGRTLLGYRSILNAYLIPFFGSMAFSHLNSSVFENFISWARKKRLRKDHISNTTVNKYFDPLRMICKYVSVKNNWINFSPFFQFRNLPEENPIVSIFPFTIGEQMEIRKTLPDHWKPYFDFAFRSGLRPSEQIGLKSDDIDFVKNLLYVKRAVTLDKEGKRIEGNTKNKHSRRTIKLTEAMAEPLNFQKEIQCKLQSKYFFCTQKGSNIDLSNLRQNVWIPALKMAGLKLREMKQTRHSFATNALSLGENPLWIAKVMGHSNTKMVVDTYTKYIENTKSAVDGKIMSDMYKNAYESIN